MTDDHIKEGFYLVTYKWKKHDWLSPDWRLENKAIAGCPGVWWARVERERKDLFDRQQQVFMNTGQPLNRPTREDHQFLYATPITREGYNALHGVVS